MCVTATVEGSTTQYNLSGTGIMAPGWMGVGFGSQMADSPMVILWSNSDGTITLSQRQAPAEVMPTVVSNPPRTATLLNNVSTASGSSPQFVFSIPSESTVTVPTIWAFGSINPGSSSPSATLQMHLESIAANFDLSKDFNGTTGSTVAASSTALLPFQRLVIAHGILLTIGFLVFLPSGVLLARYLRTFSAKWFTGHWIVQVMISGPVIIIGFALGIRAVVETGAPPLSDNHMKWGVAIFVLYIFQCSLGAFIHWVKFDIRVMGRPPQNYFHALLGLFIIGIALYQVRTGYRSEWPKIGRGALGVSTDDVWYTWVVILPVFYIIGLAFLPKQLRQEKSQRKTKFHESREEVVLTDFETRSKE
ncbi:hypothetical protein BT96DRAFT_868385 [Gymnopus androsaceus JB14]|uniref:CBD9-like protein n=1 Tax=Gymnopus androsaceus JB14 TaxID=1447944 RepID=A0A6A4GIL7_9AGAR|nr:hypothetical protein BT96DRAFT_868385 [Gymnopus androsaceus JB14]